MKKFEVTVEIIEQYEVTVFADSPGDAWAKADKISLDEVNENACMNDFEKRVVGVRRDTDAKMYK